MASDFSPDLRIELIANGEQSGTWGNTTNNNLGTLIEDAISGVTTYTTATSPYTLTALNGVEDQARSAVLNLTTSTGANYIVVVPSVTKTYIVRNSSSLYTLTVKTAAGTGVAIPPLKTVLVRCDATNVVESLNHVVDNFSLGGTLTAAGDTTLSGALSVAKPVTVTTSAFLGGSQTVTIISVASPSIITVASAPASGTAVVFTTSGTLPTGLTVGTVYYVSNINATTFNVSTSSSLTPLVNVTVAGSGTHTVGNISLALTPPAESNSTQIATTAFVAGTVPTGTINMWPTATAPTGFLLCDGTAVSRTTYASLFSVLGTVFGAGDASTTFNLPNYVNRMPFGASAATTASVTGFIGALVVAQAGARSTSASISGSTLTVGGTITGTFAIGQTIVGSNIAAGTTITGGSGTSWTISPSAPVAIPAGTVTALSTTLTVASTTFGTAAIGQELDSTAFTTTSTQNSVTIASGTGPYTLSNAVYIAPSTSVNLRSTTLTVSSVGSGAIAIGQVISGAGISGSAHVVAFGTGTGGAGTYTLDGFEQTTTGATTITAAPFAAIGATGGDFDAILPSHSHSITDPTHDHTMHAQGAMSGTYLSNDNTSYSGGGGNSFGTRTSPDTGVRTSFNTTNITINSRGESALNKNLSPYLGINFIIKT